MHGSTTLESTYEESVTLLRDMHNPIPMEPSHDENFELYNPLGELVISPTSYTSIFCSIHPNEVWVKVFILMVAHEEYVHYISPFDVGIIRAPSYLNFYPYPYLHYDYTHLHGCTYYVHLETHDFPCPFPSLFEVGGTSSHTWVRVI